MATINIRQEDAEFLRDLQNELLTQECDGQADPVFWGVIETREDAVPDGCGEVKVHLGDGNVKDLNGCIEFVGDYIDDEPEEVHRIWCEDVNQNDIGEVADFIRNVLKMQADLVEVSEVSFISRETGAFLTKRACREYINRFGYNHSRPHTYAMTAYRNYELARLLKILKTIDFKKNEL